MMMEKSWVIMMDRTDNEQLLQDQELWTTKFLVLWSNTVELTTTDSWRQLDITVSVLLTFKD